MSNLVLTQLLPEEAPNALQKINNILLNYSLSLFNEHFNKIYYGTDNDCYFHSVAILLELSTVEFKCSLLDFITNINNVDVIQSLILKHRSSVSDLIARLSIGGNTCGVYCDIYNELVLKVYLLDVHTHYMLKDPHVEIDYVTKTSDRRTQSTNRVINLLLASVSTGSACFLPLKNI